VLCVELARTAHWLDICFPSMCHFGCHRFSSRKGRTHVCACFTSERSNPVGSNPLFSLSPM
jgi:hypothetical protein